MPSRSAVPSQAQLEKLVDIIDEKRWLATGHARTSHARDKTRAAWQEIAVKLNSDGRGCIKTWQQWAKYWRDKKSAVKKKASQLRMARQRTGGDALEEDSLSSIEERILAIMGGEGFAVGNRDMEINPFHQTNESESMAPPEPDLSAGQNTPSLNIQNIEVDVASTSLPPAPNSESILQVYVDSVAVEPGTAAGQIFIGDTELSTPSVPEPRPGTSRSTRLEPQQQQTGQQLCEDRPSARNDAPSATSSPRRRRRLATTRRRILRRSPPSQRQSQMASLTERFIAIEEQRAAVENELAENQRSLINVLREMSEAWSRQSQALQDLVRHVSNR